MQSFCRRQRSYLKYIFNTTELFYTHSTHIRKMVVFTQKINGITGCSEWDVKDDDYDYHQEIARSAFADMLHDTERNQKYFLGLKAAIDKMHGLGKPANVLDIGTGTGLLSMMAAQCGADTITACEAFQPMAECAVKIIQDNGFSSKINVISKRSTELTVGIDGDMSTKANILVTEVFDTELIGEGAIETFSHAHLKLLDEDCIVVPSSATIYAQVVECPTLQKWNKLIDVADDDGNILIKTPTEMKLCNGSAAVHDIQLSQLPVNSFKEVMHPIPVLQYDWSGKIPLKKNISKNFSAMSLITGKAQMVFMWWDLQVDTDGKVLLSCAPWWQHPDADIKSKYPENSIPWRDHWMQGVYYFPNEIAISKDDELTLIASQDEYSLWFDLNNKKSPVKQDLLRPVCDCGIHMTYSRTHVASMNDGARNKKLLRVLEDNITKDTICLCINGASLMGLAAAKMGAKKVFYIESGIIAKRILNAYIVFNDLSDSIVILPTVESVRQLYPDDEITLVFGDPNFNSAILPWDNLHLGHVVGKLKPMLNENAKIIPGKCSLWIMSVEFLDLHKIKAPLDTCENINLKTFDNLIEDSRTRCDDEIEPQPLWEYPCLCKSTPVKIMDINLNTVQQTIQHSQGKSQCEINADYNGFVFWLEWDLDGKSKNMMSSGPIKTPELNERISWDPFSRQGVKILVNSKRQTTENSLKYNVICDLSDGNINIDVLIE